MPSKRASLREFDEADRAAFIAYQTDPRYRRLYDFDDAIDRPNGLFDQFLEWQGERPRRNHQLAIVEAATGQLVGCGGLRLADEQSAILGVELAPEAWGRFRIAIDAIDALLHLGFDRIGLTKIFGDTASGNRRIEKLATWYGAELVAERPGPAWMHARGWTEVDWSLSRERWQRRLDCRSKRSETD